MNIAVVTARIGSKGIHEKNIQDFCGKPLCYWVLKELEKSNVKTIFFLTDSFKIAHIVRSLELEKVRIEIVSEMDDQSLTDDVVHKFFKGKEYFHYSSDDTLLIAQVTSPLTTFKDYNKALQMIESKEVDSVVSVTEGMRFFWDRKTGEPVNHPKGIRLRRQDYKNNVIENGAFYATQIGLFMKSGYRVGGKIGFCIMPEFTSVEIDNEVDWKFCETLYRHYLLKPMYPKNIKLLVCDLDGVLTDCGTYVDEHGKQSKKFNFRDGHGISLLQKAGIKFGVITAGKSEINVHRFKKRTIKADFLVEGCNDKLSALKEMTFGLNLTLNDVGFIGDDVLDMDCLKAVALPACPSNANDKIKNLAGVYILSNKGGEGCVRELIDHILS